MAAALKQPDRRPCAESFSRVGLHLKPPMRELSRLQSVMAALSKYLFPLVYNIMILNFMLSVLIQAFEAVRRAVKSEVAKVCARSWLFVVRVLASVYRGLRELAR